MNCAECPLRSGSARINSVKCPRCPFAPRRIKKMSVGHRPNLPECPFVRESFFENGHSGEEEPKNVQELQKGEDKMRWRRGEIYGESWEYYLSSSCQKSDQHVTCRKKVPFVLHPQTLMLSSDRLLHWTKGSLQAKSVSARGEHPEIYEEEEMETEHLQLAVMSHAPPATASECRRTCRQETWRWDL